MLSCSAAMLLVYLLLLCCWICLLAPSHAVQNNKPVPPNKSIAWNTTHPNSTFNNLNPNTFKCNLCQYNFTIILATGRSGSTTMLGMLNQLDQYDLSGEHRKQLDPLFEMFTSFQMVRNFSKQSFGYGSAWYGRTPNDVEFFCWIQSWFQVISGWKGRFHPTDVHGFKEIRYNRTDVLEFIYQVFPCANYVINLRRNITNQHKSEFKQNVTIDVLYQHNDVLLQFAERHATQSHVMYLEEYANLHKWNTLFVFLQRSYCHAHGVLQTHTKGKYIVDTRRVVFCNPPKKPTPPQSSK